MAKRPDVMRYAGEAGSESDGQGLFVLQVLFQKGHQFLDCVSLFSALAKARAIRAAQMKRRLVAWNQLVNRDGRKASIQKVVSRLRRTISRPIAHHTGPMQGGIYAGSFRKCNSHCHWQPPR